MAIAIYVDYACDTINSTSTTSPDGGHHDVPATRYFEDIQGGRVLGAADAAFADLLAARRLPVLFHRPEPLEIWPTTPTPACQASHPRAWPPITAATRA